MEHSPGRVGSYLFWILLSVIAVSTVAGGARRRHVLAYDYHRVFNRDLQTGSCVDSLKPSSTEGFWDVVKCETRKSGRTVRHEQLTEKWGVVTLVSASRLFDLTGLCDGVLASRLGLLNAGDCAVVELAKGIPFTDKTLTFAQYIKIGIAVEKLDGVIDNVTQSGTYVYDVEYGAFEIVTVTLFFNTTTERAIAYRRRYNTSGLTSRYLTVTENLTGLRRVRVCTFSTTKNLLHSRDFWLPSMSLVGYLHQQEAHIDAMKGQNLTSDVGIPDPRRYPLRYKVGPEVRDPGFDWTEVTILEVVMAARKSVAKDEYDDFCGNDHDRYEKGCTKLAKVIERFDSKVVKFIHSGRQRWYLKTRSAMRFIEKANNRIIRMAEKLDKTLSRVVKSTTEFISSIRIGRLREKPREPRKNKMKGKSRSCAQSKRCKNRRKGKTGNEKKTMQK